MTSEPKKPKDLGIKIGTPDEAFWNAVKEKAKADILSNDRSTMINEKVIELAEQKIKEEQDKKGKI